MEGLLSTGPTLSSYFSNPHPPQGLREQVLRQQGGGHPQGHLPADRHRRAPDVSPGGALPAEAGAGDGREDPLHLGHQVTN